MLQACILTAKAACGGSESLPCCCETKDAI